MHDLLHLTSRSTGISESIHGVIVETVANYDKTSAHGFTPWSGRTNNNRPYYSVSDDLMITTRSVIRHAVHQREGHHAVGGDVGMGATSSRVHPSGIAARGGGAGRWGVLTFSIVVLVAIRTGWQNRTTMLLDAESGLGYALGIVGSLLMLALLLYPLRKRARFMRHFGPVRHWFRAHMVLGILGPLCILFHASFQWGALNSNVALVCMLLVAGSGLAGRYIYTRIHHGLYGQRASLAELGQQAAAVWSQLTATTALPETLSLRLHRLEASALVAPRGLLDGALRAVVTAFAAPWHRYCARRELHRQLYSGQTSIHEPKQRRVLYRRARQQVFAYIATVQKLSLLHFYERVFALWHVLHMPLFLMMLITGIVHVVFVHMY